MRNGEGSEKRGVRLGSGMEPLIWFSSSSGFRPSGLFQLLRTCRPWHFGRPAPPCLPDAPGRRQIVSWCYPGLLASHRRAYRPYARDP